MTVQYLQTRASGICPRCGGRCDNLMKRSDDAGETVLICPRCAWAESPDREDAIGNGTETHAGEVEDSPS